MSFYKIFKISEAKVEIDFESFHCDDIGLYVIGKYPRLKYNGLAFSENFNWDFHTISTIRLTILNHINKGVIDIYQTKKKHHYLFNLIKRESIDYELRVVDLHLDKDWFSVLVHKVINEVNRSDKPSLYKYVKGVFDETIYNGNYRNPSRAFIIQILRQYAKKFDWIKIERKKKYYGLLDDFSLNVDSIYIPRINMQHQELVKLDSTLFYNNRMYSDFYHQLGHTIERDLKRRLNNNE